MKRTTPLNKSWTRARLWRLALPAVIGLALLGPARHASAQNERMGYQWVDGKDGVPANDIKRTVGITVGAIIGGLVVLGWLLRSKD